MPDMALSDWKVQLPVASSTSAGLAMEQPASQNKLPWYRIHETQMQIVCPTTGALQGGSSSPRTELYQNSDKKWSTGTITLYATMRECERRTHIMQIFYKSTVLSGPVFQLFYDPALGFYYRLLKPGGVPVVPDRMFGFMPKLGEEFGVKLSLSGTALKVIAWCGDKREEKTDTISSLWSGPYFRFKFGCYRGYAYMQVHDMRWSSKA
jgi:hypothetical protein